VLDCWLTVKDFILYLVKFSHASLPHQFGEITISIISSKEVMYLSLLVCRSFIAQNVVNNFLMNFRSTFRNMKESKVI